MRRKIELLLLTLWVITLFPFTAWSAPVPNQDRVAVALVIDNSGSMRETDPDNNRFAASQMVVELLTATDYLSITTFSSETVDLIPMEGLTEEQSGDARESLASVPRATGDTDYLKAFTQAEANLAEVTDPDIRKFIIFLTDGTPDPGDDAMDMDRYMEDLDEKVRGIGESGISIYTVGFGDTDKAILEEIADMTRGASFEGDSSAVAGSFFGILQELKNRFSLIDETVSGVIAEPYVLTMDEYTSRITLLTQGGSGDNSITVKRDDGADVRPVMEAENVRVFHINEDPERPDATYTVSGALQGRIRAVRDTKTKLWIQEPLNNAQLPLEGEVTARVSQTGVVGGTTEVRAALSQNGSAIQHPMTTTWAESGSEYEISLGELPQTGTYELEVGLYRRNQLITKTSATFEVKNLPILATSLTDEPAETWIAGEPFLVTASLSRSGQTLNQGLGDTELSLEILQDGVQEVISLLDDGKASSGDFIAGDGIYSALITLLEPGEITASVSARGILLNEVFLITSQAVEQELFQPGQIDVLLPETVSISEGKGSVSVKATSQAAYQEELIALVNGAQLNIPPIQLAPGESVDRTLPIEVTDAEDLEITFQPVHSSTEIIRNTDSLRVAEAVAEEQSLTPQLLLAIAGGLLLVIGGFLILRRLPLMRNKATLQGALTYRRPDQETWDVLPLSGREPMVFSIGGETQTAGHIQVDITPGFTFTLRPISSGKGTEVVELTLSPPGVLTSSGQTKSSTLLSKGDEFRMAGLDFRYEVDSGEESGINVLSGKL